MALYNLRVTALQALQPNGSLVEFTMEFVTFHGSQNGPFGELFLVLPDTSLTHNTICESFFLQPFFGDVFGKARTLSLELPLQRERRFHV